MDINKKLLKACRTGDLASAQDAVRGGAQVNFISKKGCTPIMNAMWVNHNHNNRPVIKWLLSLDRVDVNIRETVDTRENSLHIACHYCDYDIVREVLRRSEEGMVNRVDGNHFTPVQWAVYSGNVGAVLGLIGDERVDWGVTDKEGRSLLEMARSKTDTEIKSSFIRAKKESDIVTLLQLIIPSEGIQSSTECLDILLDKVIDIGKTSVMREVCLRSRVDQVIGVDLLMKKARKENFFWLSFCFEGEFEMADADIGLDQLDWLTNQATQAIHVNLFGRNGRRQFGSQTPLYKIIKFINIGGETMVKQREQMIDILILVDKEENPHDNDGRNTRIKETIKMYLESGTDLTQWLQSTSNKFPKQNSEIIKSICISGLSALFGGLGMFAGDIGTDGYFTAAMKNLYEIKLGNRTNNCSRDLEMSLDDIESACRPTSDYFDHMNCSKQLVLSVQKSKCLTLEEDRFSSADQFYQMFIVSLATILLPLTIFLFCGITLAIKKKDWRKVLIFFPPVAKCAGFITEYHLNWCMANPKKNEKKIKKLKKEKEEQSETLYLAMQIEANLESSFQFTFQTLYTLPVLVLSIYSTSEMQTAFILENLFNLKTFSIAVSFVSMAYSFVRIRNHAKKGALTPVHIALLLSRTVLDTMGRILLIFTWLHVLNGNFDPLVITTTYYAGAGILLIFNIIFNSSGLSTQPHYILGLLLNSLSSLLSYNHSNEITILMGEKARKERKKKTLHQPTLTRQILYTLLVTFIYFGFSVWTFCLMSDNMHITDLSGHPHLISQGSIKWLLASSWLCHIAACILTICYYLAHPSQIQKSPKGKGYVLVLGTERYFSWVSTKDAEIEDVEAVDDLRPNTRREETETKDMGWQKRIYNSVWICCHKVMDKADKRENHLADH